MKLPFIPALVALAAAHAVAAVSLSTPNMAFEINADDLECDPCARFDDLTARRPFSEEQLDALRVPGTLENPANDS